MTTAAAHPQVGHGDPSCVLRRALITACAAVAAGVSPPPWRGLLLTGSVARGESVWQRHAGHWRLCGDIDLIAISRDPHQAAVCRPALHRALATALERESLQAELSLSAGGIGFLERLPPSIFSFELLTVGEVLWGERTLLNHVPRCPITAIPREDAWRLLNNRIVELVAALAEGPGAAAVLAMDKLYLDMTASWLLFAGGYALDSGTRLHQAEQLQDLHPEAVPWPRASSWLPRLRAATALRAPAWRTPDPAAAAGSKLPAGAAPADNTPPRSATALIREAASDARDLWRWELNRLGRKSLAQHARSRPAGPGAAAWLAAAGAAGGLATRLRCAAQVLAAPTASPRYRVYAAASEWLWAYPLLTPAARQAASRLPLPPPGEASALQVAATIGANYQLFVASTGR